MDTATFANEQYQFITQCVTQVAKQRYKFVYKLDGDLPESYMPLVIREMLSIEEKGDHLEGSPTTVLILDREYADRLALARRLYPLYRSM